MSACDPLIQAERRFKSRFLNRSRWELVPLPRAGGALSRAVASIRDLQGQCQTVVCQTSRSGRHQCAKLDALRAMEINARSLAPR